MILPAAAKTEASKKDGCTLESCDCGDACGDLSRTVVLLCELLVGVRHYFWRARLLTPQDVRVHRGAVQHQRPLLQFACGNRSNEIVEDPQRALLASLFMCLIL